MTSMDDMHRMMHGEQESHDEYMRRATAARDESDWEMGSMFEKMAHDESQHKMDMSHMLSRMGGASETGYWFAVWDRTDKERFAGSQRHTSTSVAVAAARSYITDRIEATGYLQDHDLEIEVYLAAPQGGLVTGDAFHSESYVHFATTPLREVLGSSRWPASEHDWVTLAADIKTRYTYSSPYYAEANTRLGIIMGLEEGDVQDAQQWLVDKGAELGLL